MNKYVPSCAVTDIINRLLAHYFLDWHLRKPNGIHFALAWEYSSLFLDQQSFHFFLAFRYWVTFATDPKMWGSPNSFPTENANVTLIATREKLDKLLDILSGKFMAEYCLFTLSWWLFLKATLFSEHCFVIKQEPPVFIKARREIDTRRLAEPTRS